MSGTTRRLAVQAARASRGRWRVARWLLLVLTVILHALLGDAPPSGAYIRVANGKAVSAEVGSPPPAPQQPRARILVCIAAHHEPGKSTTYLDTLLREYATVYSRHYDVAVRVDTNSPELAAHIAAGPAGAIATAQVYSAAELGDPLHLPQVHRHAMQQAVEDFDFFWFTEDDVLVPLESFRLYESRRAELWERGWLFGWVRAERWGVDNATAISVDNVDPVVDAPVYVSPAGHAYAEPWSPYTAFYVLDRAQLRAMLADGSRVWYHGFPPFMPRERISIGWAYAFTGGSAAPYGAKGWRARVLVPLELPSGRVDPRAVAWHLPRKYAQSAQLYFHDLGAVPVDEVFNWTAGGPPAPIPLPQLPPQ